MKQLILSMIAAICLVATSGCGNLSPRQDQKIDNKDGHIDEIKNNQNGIMSELGTLKNQSDIQNSKLDKVQQGMINMQSTNENSGVQVLSGPGGILVTMVGFACLTVLLLHYRSQAKIHKISANILAERMVHMGDPALEDSVFQAAMHTAAEENILDLVKKHKYGS